MSKWKDDFCSEFQTTAVVKRLNQEIGKQKIQRETENLLSEVIKGKHRRSK